jgi:hypothetical protein
MLRLGGGRPQRPHSAGDALILAAPEMLIEAETRRAGDPAGAAFLRHALIAPPMTVETVGM